jgi:toxin ParE1/3/4
MPDARRVIWAPKAEDDLREIWHYFVRVASPETAENLLREITSASVRLGERPFLLGRSRDEVKPGLRSTLVSPHVIFYRVTEMSVEVVRVLHQHQNLPAYFPPNES